MAISPTEIRNWVIYKITSPSGRIYIGKSSNFKQRKSHYKNFQLKKQDLITRSLVKYGFESHVFETIDQFVSNSDYASGKEMFWIRSWMSNKNKFKDGRGMNMTNGGEGALGMVRSEKSKEEARQRNLGKKLTPEHKENISKGLQGKARGSKGRIQSQEEREMRRRSAKNKKPCIEGWYENLASANRKRESVPVLLFDKSGNIVKEYPSLKSVAEEHDITRDTVRSIIRGARPNKVNRHLIIKYKHEWLLSKTSQ